MVSSKIVVFYSAVPRNNKYFGLDMRQYIDDFIDEEYICLQAETPLLPR